LPFGSYRKTNLSLREETICAALVHVRVVNKICRFKNPAVCSQADTCNVPSSECHVKNATSAFSAVHKRGAGVPQSAYLTTTRRP
jgi:hypothetical protein